MKSPPRQIKVTTNQHIKNKNSGKRCAVDVIAPIYSFKLYQSKDTGNKRKTKDGFFSDIKKLVLKNTTSTLMRN